MMYSMAGLRGERLAQRVRFAKALVTGGLIAMAGAGVSSTAKAAGLEETVSGARGLGRAATLVSVNDFMATWQNPANLAAIPLNDLGFELRLPLFQACFDRARDNSLDYQTPVPENGITGTEHFDKVCNEAGTLPTGHLGWAASFKEGWGYGIGFFTPAAIPGYKYGDPTIITAGASEMDTATPTLSGVESPTRFMLLQRNALAGFLMAGIGASPMPALRVGMSAGFGFATIQNVSVSSATGGKFDNADPEILSTVDVSDSVIPRFMASFVAGPTEGLELMGSITYQDDIRGEGTLELEANGYQGVPLRDCRATIETETGPKGAPGTHCRLDNIELLAPMPTLEAVLGLRYASLRGKKKRVLNPMADENWDVEFNGYWSMTSHVDQYTLKFHEETFGPGSPQVQLQSTPNAAPLPAPEGATINRGWHDTFGARLGGDINLVPETFSVRWGLSIESRAVPKNNMNIDVWPIGKYGLHLGATLALSSLRLTLGYAHLFYESITTPVGQGGVVEIVSQRQEMALGVNEGSYSAALDVVSLGLNTTFD